METRGLFADKYKDDFQTVLRTVESLAILLCSSHDITKTHFATTYTNYNQSFEHSYHCGCKPFCFVLSHHSMKDQRHSCKINEAVGIRILEASEIRYVVRNELHCFAFHRVGTCNGYKHQAAETAQYRLEIILKWPNSIPYVLE